jgi:hypothetical protein
MDKITSMDQIPKTGIAVLLCQVEERSPCKKFYNEMNACISELMQDVQAQWLVVELTPEIREAIRSHYLPTVIVYKNGEETKRFTGHYWGKFQISDYIREGL